MDSNGIILTVIAGIIGLLGLTAVSIDRRGSATVPFEDGPSALAGETPVRESTQDEPAEDREVQGERRRLVEAKDSAEKAYAQRVSAAELEFNAKMNRADVHLRAAEMFLEHAQEQGRRSSPEAVRGPEGTLTAWEPEIDFDREPFGMDDAAQELAAQEFVFSRPTRRAPAVNLANRLLEIPETRWIRRIRDARERLADAMLEHRFAVAAAEKVLANAKAQDDDVQSATAALEAFDARNDGRDNNCAEQGRRSDLAA
ncbi:hypothetical protein [Sinomonas terrae]|uniref:DUF4398 domain-containing protein n=1 Tax=Sinomonas terrae TaxID=2908838 RepID=A0ABS9U0Z4_9MICC|nr:hypothetical protein [Sinomonas terrae]MCH6470303.1 hypothetical protein [Sinomonas terrae]